MTQVLLGHQYHRVDPAKERELPDPDLDSCFERAQHWRANIACGIRLYQVKMKEAALYEKKLLAQGRTIDPKGVRTFTQRQDRLECLERYNGGAYWSHWSVEKRQWVRRLPPKNPPYADALIDLVEGLERKPPVFPKEWDGD